MPNVVSLAVPDGMPRDSRPMEGSLHETSRFSPAWCERGRGRSKGRRGCVGERGRPILSGWRMTPSLINAPVTRKPAHSRASWLPSPTSDTHTHSTHTPLSLLPKLYPHIPAHLSGIPSSPFYSPVYLIHLIHSPSPRFLSSGVVGAPHRVRTHTHPIQTGRPISRQQIIVIHRAPCGFLPTVSKREWPNNVHPVLPRALCLYREVASPRRLWDN